MSLSEQQPIFSQGNDSRTNHYPTLLKVKKNTKLKQSLTRRSSRMGSSTGSSGKDMKRQLGNLRVTLDEQKTQLKTWRDATRKAISLLTDMAIAARLGKRTRPMANTFMNFYDKKFKPVLRHNYSVSPTGKQKNGAHKSRNEAIAQRDRSMQIAKIQDRGIQDLGSCKELGLANALRSTAVKTDEQHLDRNVINLTGNTNGERTRACTHRSDPGVVQKGGDVVPPPQESVDNSSSLFDYKLDNLYNDLIDDFDPYLEYGKGYQNKTAFKDAFYG